MQQSQQQSDAWQGILPGATRVRVAGEQQMAYSPFVVTRALGVIELNGVAPGRRDPRQ